MNVIGNKLFFTKFVLEELRNTVTIFITARCHGYVSVFDVPEYGRDPGVAGVVRENLVDRTCALCIERRYLT